jgi:hypothetical protein
MDAEKFIEYLKIFIRDSSIEDAISLFEKPPGRKPDDRIKKLSIWYNSLSKNDKENIKEVITEAIDSSIFGLLCVIDGVRALEDAEEKGKLKLYYSKEDKETLLNKDDQEYLHDIYKRQI